MTSYIMHSVLTKLNSQMKAQSHKILLFLDGAGCHPSDLAVTGGYSNIKIVSFPPNTTSALQLLDLGIIKKFKVYYRQFLLRYVCAQIEECSTANEIINSVTVLHAIRWVEQGWGKVSSTTIQKCFRKAGILDRDFSVMKRASAINHDPFEDLDEELDTSDLQTFISQVQQDISCSVEEFVNGDQDLHTSVNIYRDEWSEQFLNSLPGPTLKARSDSETAPALDDDMEVAEQEEEGRVVN